MRLNAKGAVAVGSTGVAALLALGSVAWACSGLGSICSPTTEIALPGQPAEVSGRAWTVPSVEVRWYGTGEPKVLATAVPSGAGAFTVGYTVPDEPAGLYALKVIGISGTQTYEATSIIEVTSAPVVAPVAPATPVAPAEPVPASPGKPPASVGTTSPVAPVVGAPVPPGGSSSPAAAPGGRPVPTSGATPGPAGGARPGPLGPAPAAQVPGAPALVGEPASVVAPAASMTAGPSAAPSLAAVPVPGDLWSSVAAGERPSLLGASTAPAGHSAPGLGAVLVAAGLASLLGAALIVAFPRRRAAAAIRSIAG